MTNKQKFKSISKPKLELELGQITTSYGRLFIVEIDGQYYEAVTRGKKTEFVVGDKILAQIINHKQVQIMQLHERENLIYRSDHNRSKMIASNINQILIVIAIKPSFNLNFLNSCLVAAEASNIEPVIIVNKTDLPETAEFLQKIIQLYKNELNYNVITMSANSSCDILKPLLTNKSSLLIGQSGVGKSTITNQIIINANARVAQITKAETSGSHTTTNAQLYHINSTSDLIDCPGLQEFGLYHLDIERIGEYFPELREYLGKCRFRNCLHQNEPNCPIIEAAKHNKIDKNRLTLLQQITTRLQSKPNY